MLSIKTSCSHDHGHEHSEGHSHDQKHDEKEKEKTIIDSLGYIFADITHSFCEGLLISVAFIHSVKLGHVTVLSV